MTDRVPKWQKWQFVPEVEIWKAVALSFGVDPDNIKFSRHQHFQPFDEGEDFNDRLEIACANCGDGKALRLKKQGASGPSLDAIVSLPDFVSWATKLWPDIPSELKGMAATTEPALSTAERKPAAFDAKLKDIQEAYERLRTKTGKAPSQRAVADHSGYTRDTVRSRWSQLKR